MDLRGPIRIQYIDEYGLEEAGIDGGGLFKDFMEALMKEGFDPRAGLFAATADNKLFPNPSAGLAQPDALDRFHFLGRMLGKASPKHCKCRLPTHKGLSFLALQADLQDSTFKCGEGLISATSGTLTHSLFQPSTIQFDWESTYQASV